MADGLHKEFDRYEIHLKPRAGGRRVSKFHHAAIEKIRTPDDVRHSRLFKGPLVVINNALPEVPFPQVVPDDIAIGRMAAHYFLRRGFRRFVYAGDGSGFGKLRGNGFLDALKEYGAADVRRSHGISLDHIVPIRELISGHPGEPVAVFCCNDWMAHSVIHRAAAERIDCPRNIAVLGVDNDHLPSACCHVPISSVELPEYEIGRRAAGLVARMLRGEPPPTDPIRIPPIGVIGRRSSDRYACDDPRLLRAVRFIEANSNRSISIQDIANAAGKNVAARTLQRRFRNAFGETMIDALLRSRVGRAKSLLTSSELSVKEITYLTGFASSSHFSLTFRRFEGMTPGAFRKRILSDTR